MKRVKYSKYIPNLAEEVSLEDLMDALSDFLLESGFEDELGRYYRQGNGDDQLDALREAIREALLNSDIVRRRDARADAAVAERRADGRTDRRSAWADAAGGLRHHLSATRCHAHVNHGRKRGTGPIATAARKVPGHRQGTGLPRAIAPCAICSAHWGAPALDATTPAILQPELRPVDQASSMSLATP